MTPRRAVILVLLVLFVFGFVVQAVRGPATAPGAAPVPTPAASTPASTADTAAGAPVRHALAAVQSAFNAGDVAQLCRPARLLDRAVIHQQNQLPGGCESELEGLVANEQPLQLSLHQLALKQGLASAIVTTRNGSDVSVDFINDGGRWLLSFSGGNDPMPALADND
jgi:hypothetical protein